MTEIEYEGKNTVDGSEISEAFNDYFINIGPKLAAVSTSNSSNNVLTRNTSNEVFRVISTMNAGSLCSRHVNNGNTINVFLFF